MKIDALKKRINNEIDTSLETDSSTRSASEILFQSVSPRTKVRAKQRLKFTETQLLKKALRVDKAGMEC